MKGRYIYNSSTDTLTPVESDVMAGASSQTAGAKGLVPAPSAGDEGKFLKGDGTWGNPSASGGVTSFNGRTGAVTPANGDYDYSQIANTPSIPGGVKIGTTRANATDTTLYFIRS